MINEDDMSDLEAKSTRPAGLEAPKDNKELEATNQAT